MLKTEVLKGCSWGCHKRLEKDSGAVRAELWNCQDAKL